MRPLPDLGMESRGARVRLQLPPAAHAGGIGIFEIARAFRTPSRRARCHAAEICQSAMENDGRGHPRGFDPGHRCEEPAKYGVRGSGPDCGENSMSTKPNAPAPSAPEGQESYVVSEGKKRGSTREVRDAAAYNRFYTVLRVHG